MDFKARFISGAALITIALSGCAQTSHPTTSASIGKPISSSAMEALIDQPGPIEVKTVGVDFVAEFSGLLNLKDPKAVQAGLKDHEEPIKIYTHLLKHPTQGFFMVDTGVSKKMVEDPASLGVGWVLRQFVPINKMLVRDQDTLSVIKSEGAPLKGVLMTHLHFDHISGLPDVPKETPIYTGPGEASEKKAENFFSSGMINAFLDGRPALQEFQFTKDPDGKFEGVVDVFGDGSLFAIFTPGHTAGHVSYLARTPSGPVLMTGDACHTRWGWENGVEPGSYTFDRESEKSSLLALKALSERHPKMIVRLGHQP